MYDDDDYNQVVEEKNTLGLLSFIFALSCVLSPIALILGVIGLGKRPRGFAIAGTLISILLIAAFATAWFSFGYYMKAGMHMGVNGSLEAIEAYEYNPDSPPESLSDLGLSETQQKDYNGNPIRFDGIQTQGGRTMCNILFPGPDGALDTSDDFVLPMEMKK